MYVIDTYCVIVDSGFFCTVLYHNINYYFSLHQLLRYMSLLLYYFSYACAPQGAGALPA